MLSKPKTWGKTLRYIYENISIHWSINQRFFISRVSAQKSPCGTNPNYPLFKEHPCPVLGSELIAAYNPCFFQVFVYACSNLPFFRETGNFVVTICLKKPRSIKKQFTNFWNSWPHLHELTLWASTPPWHSSSAWSSREGQWDTTVTLDNSPCASSDHHLFLRKKKDETAKHAIYEIILHYDIHESWWPSESINGVYIPFVYVSNA